MSNEILLTAPIGIFQSKANGPYKAGHRLFITVEDLESLPDELFATKVSQSQNPELSGKVIFKHFSFKANENSPWTPQTPQGTQPVTPPAELKAQVLEKLGNMENAEFRLTINIPGAFCNIDTPDGRFTIFDKNEFPDRDGNPGYYVKSGSVCNIKLTPASHMGNQYFQVLLSTGLAPDDLFVKSGRAQVWGQEDRGTAAGSSYESEDIDDGSSPW